MGGLDFGAIIDLVNGIMRANKSRNNGTVGNRIDTTKISLVLLTFAGRQGFSWYLNRRRNKRDSKLLARGVRFDKIGRKKRGKFFPGLLIGASLGVGGYLSIMKPEDREALFKTINNVIDEIMGLVGEIQGKPYSSDYQN